MRKIVKGGEAHGQKPAQRAKRPLPFAGANAARFVRWAQQKVEPEIRLKRGPVLAMAGMPLWNASMAETRLFGARRPVWTRCMASFCKVLQPRLDKMFCVAWMPLWNASMAEVRLFGSAAAGMDAPHGGLLQNITAPA